MKRKILSLALALMMIISVAAALPVSAEDVADIILGWGDENLAASNTGGVSTTYEPSPDYGWVPKGYIAMGSSKNTTITATVNVETSGYYDFYIAARAYNATKTHNVSTGFYCDGEWMFDFAPGIGADTATTIETKAGVVYLEKGVRTIEFVRKSTTGLYYFQGFKLAYAGTTAPATIVSAATSYTSVSNTYSGVNITTEPTDTFGWVQRGCITCKNGTTATYDVNVLKAGTYAITLAVQARTSATALKVTVGEGTATTVSVPAVATNYTTVEVAVPTTYNLTAGKNTITISGSSGYPYYQGMKLDYQGEKYKITANAAEGGTVTGGAAVEKGESVTLTATPDKEYEFIGWFDGSDTQVSSSASYTINNVEADATYTAKFKKVRVIVSIYPSHSFTGISNTGGVDIYTTQNDTTSWIPKGYAIFTQNKTPRTRGVYTVNMPENGYYDIYVAAAPYMDGQQKLTELTANIYEVIDGTDSPIVLNRSVGDLTGVTTTTAKTVYMTSVYLTKGEHEIAIQAVNGHAYLFGMKLEYIGAEKTAQSIAFTDEKGAAASSATVGEYIFAEVVTSDSAAKLFLVQYTGSGENRKMVATSYNMSDATPSYVGGKYFYRAALETVSGAGEVKAFLWTTDGKYIPLLATSSVSVN